MRKLLSIIITFALSASCYADGDIPALCISTTNGTATIALRDIVSIKYTGNDMVINKTAGTNILNLNEITEMLFGTTADTAEDTAVRGLEQSGNSTILYDMNGRIVFEGTDEQMQSLPHGVYLSKKGCQTKKVVL